MRTGFTAAAIGLVACAALVFGCSGSKPATGADGAGGGSDDESGLGVPKAAPAGAKDAMVQNLKDLAAAIEAGDADTAARYLYPPPGVTIEQAKPMILELDDKKEISSAGVPKFAARAKFGGCVELTGKRAKAIADEHDVSLDTCFAMAIGEQQMALGIWDGKAFRFLRVDNIGEL